MFPGADTLLVGSTRQFTATVYDYASKPLDLPVVWSSSDPAIAAIDSLGVVRAIGEGHARITAAAGTVVGSAGLSVTALRADRVWDFTQVLFGPQQVDQTVRQAVQLCWMNLPKDRRTLDELESQFRRLVERALKDFREDSEAFG